MLGALTGFLWRFNAFRLLTINLVCWFPGPIADWLAVNTPLLIGLHWIFIESGDFEMARRVVEDLRKHRGAWSL